ncbi:MAG TPA: FAD-dependent oxidoreductase [Galbitalea sp.]|jgi:2-polyprenyl-6-methoxyphenol hydroxylase-like FAD-dependent oxidoreductase|nr:FAD-dependent oxidoreductase [Galbitalea sp.]
MSAGVSVPVVVVGAGPVGLAAALLLARHGVEVLVLERRANRSDHPKARGLRMRASELAALWGFDDELRADAMPDETHRFIYTESLAGEEIARTATMTSIDESWGAVPPYRVPQDVLEQLLEARVTATHGITLRRGVTVQGLEQDEFGAGLTLDDGSKLRAEWVIAADGVASGIRSSLGIQFGSGGPTPYWQSVYWLGDLRDLTADRPAIIYYTRADARALVGVAPAGPHGRWITIAQNPPSAARPNPLDHDQAVALTRRAVGRPNLEVNVISSETFRISADVAERYRVGRVLLAGDAAHSLPPTGGFGINTGFADAHNLAWKLGLVLDGRARDSLLDSYESERKPVAESNAAWATANARRNIAVKEAMIADDRATLRALLADQQAHVDPVVQDLGFSYAPLGEGTPSPFVVPTLGARAPHAPVAAGSLLALFEGRMSLLAADPGSPWIAAARVLADPDLQVLAPGRGFEPAGSLFSERYDIGDDAILVRPDGHIGWRSTGEPATPETLARSLDAIRTVGGVW